MSKRNVLSLVCLISLVLAATATHAAAQAGPDWEALDAFIEASMKQWEVPGVAVAIVQDDAIAHIKGYGVRDLTTGAPVTPETLFAIGSASKAFTTAAISILVDEGRMQWDDPVRKHIDFFRLADPLASQHVTLRDLVTHRTGLARTTLLWYASPLSREEMIRCVAEVKLSASFREKFQYQNVMYATAGYAIGRATNNTWEEFVRQRIFKPLGMADANFSVIDAQQAPNHATPHRKKDEKVITIPWRNIDEIGPAGSINAHVRDISKWLLLHLNNGEFNRERIISEKMMKEMHTPQMVIRREREWALLFPETSQLSYGLGWFIQEYRGHQVIGHGGNIDGFSALVAFVPEGDCGFVILTNMNGTLLPMVIGNRIIDTLLKLPEKDWNAHFKQASEQFEALQKKAREEWKAKQRTGTSPSRELQAYVGTYANPAYGRATIALENGQLVFQYHSLVAKLAHFHFDTFLMKLDVLDEEMRVTFTLNPDGEVSTLSAAGIEFTRKPS